MLSVKRSAALLSFVTLLLIGGLILAGATFLFMPELARDILVSAAPVSRMDVPPGVALLYGLQAAGWVVLGLNLFVLWHIHSLFRLYARGDALSSRCGLHLRRIGLGLMLLPPGATFYGIVSSVLLSWGNGPGARELAIAVNVQSLGFLVGGALLLFVGMTIREASEIAEENRGFV
jgi:hypothetical protein